MNAVPISQHSPESSISVTDAYHFEDRPLTALTRWPGGCPLAVTFSFDDGRIEDRRLVEILNRYRLKAAFHLNSGRMGMADDLLNPEEVVSLYQGHEVAAHTVTHPFLTDLPVRRMRWEMESDRRALETRTGKVVRGMSYPFGAYNSAVIAEARAAGIAYSRTVVATRGFELPSEWLEWHPTAHECEADNAVLDRFFELQGHWHQRLRLLFLWGHSFEFSRDNRWACFEKLCAGLDSRGEGRLWRGTCAEVYQYANALHALQFSVDGSLIENPSAISVWVDVGGKAVEIPGGGTVRVC